MYKNANNAVCRSAVALFSQVFGRLFSPSYKWKKLPQKIFLHFPFGIGINVHQAKNQCGVRDLKDSPPLLVRKLVCKLVRINFKGGPLKRETDFWRSGSPPLFFARWTQVMAITVNFWQAITIVTPLLLHSWKVVVFPVLPLVAALQVR